jgi:hypothetical protein
MGQLWGDAPGWYRAGPLALQNRTRLYADFYAPTVQPHTRLGHRPWREHRHLEPVSAVGVLRAVRQTHERRHERHGNGAGRAVE